MPMYSAFAPSILGMKSQAYSLATISQNIANVTAGGYKRTETRFQTVLSDSMSSGQDFGGVRPKDVQIIDQQGVIYTTARDLDLAIVGDGFFVVSDAITGGNKFYTRDGSFEMKVLTPTTGTGSATSVPGYMVDKNGLYLMGWAPDANGVFPTSGTLQAMRVDPDYFANVFQATTTAEIGLNLPAMAQATPAVAQVNTIALSGTIEAGDVYAVTVNGTTFSRTMAALETLDTARDALIALINANTALPVTARANGTGTMNLIADTAGTAFTASATATNGGVTADNTTSNTATIANVTAQAAHATAVAAAIAGTPPAGYYAFSISVIDSNGARQPVQLNFTRSTENTWLMSATHSRTPVAQVNTVTLGGAVEPGDSYTVTVAGTPYTYTHTGTTATIDTARNALVALINANSASPVTAAAGAAGILTLTAKTAGSAFTSSTSTTNVTSTADNTANGVNITPAGVGVAQVDDVTIAGTIEAGDVYSITVNGTTFSYTLTATDTITTARNALITLINADAVLPVTASAGAGAGVVRLTADVTNTPFTRAQAATNIGGGAVNTAANATTTANVTNNTTTAASTVNFTNNGYAGTKSGSTITAPTPVAFALTFNGGSTASFSLDIDAMTQFDSNFQTAMQDTNGFEKSNLMRTTWDDQGFLVGHFTNDNSRKLYQVPLANFISPNSLHMKSGMIFEQTAESGAPTVQGVGASERAIFAPAAIEQSNVDVAQEFSRMIMTQAAYNASSVSFRTIDEMTMTARDLTKA